jgi:ribosomal-protein-alanine N-acetyltransferase
MIGAIGFYVNNIHRRGELTYALAKPYWRRGIMQIAIQKLLDYAFTQMQLERVEAITRNENKASVELLKKLNFMHEGTLHKYRFFNGKNWDIEMFAIVNEE